FQGVFDSIYARLHELRLRRLNDDADEIDLGLAYAFPEEFRRLYQPLQTYVRILFPHLKNPRAVKNLLFRGVYFTSATQDDMIPPGTVERYGAEGADQLAKLQALFPKTAYFIKDVMFRKVFPEHGLVFRNEQEVVRNRKLAHLLKYGTFGLGIILLTAFVLSFYKFEELILDPREHASDVAGAYVKGMSTDTGLDHAEKIGSEIARLEKDLMYARILSINVGTHKPIEHLKTIRVQLIESAIVEALGEIGAALRSGDAARISVGRPAKDYLSAVKAYISWFGCVEQDEASHLDFASFEEMRSIVSESGAIANQEKFLRQAKWYFEAIGSESYLERNPAKLLARVPSDPEETALAALNNVYEYFRRHYASLDEAQLSDKTMREWMRILNMCAQAEESYEAMMNLASDADRIETQSQLRLFTDEFVGKFNAFKTALDGTTWGYGATGGAATYTPIAEVILKQYQTWHEYQDELQAIVTRAECPILGQRILDSIKAISDEDPSLQREGLDCVFWRNLRNAELTIDKVCDSIVVGAFKEGNLEGLVKDVFAVYDAIIEYGEPTEKYSPPKVNLRSDAKKVLTRLEEITAGLNVNLSVPKDLSRESADAWHKGLDGLLAAAEDAEDGKIEPEVPLKVAPFWRSKELALLHGEIHHLARLGEGTVLLATMRDRLRQLDEFTWGFAGMIPWDDRSNTERSPYSIDLRSPDPEDRPRRRFGEDAEEPPASKRRSKSRRSDRRRGRSGRDSDERRDSKPASRRKNSGRTAKGRIPACATHDFLNARADELARLLEDVKDMREFRAFLSLQDEDERLDVQCSDELKRVGEAYMKEYVRAWNSAYADIKLDKLARLKKRTRSWDDLVTQLGTNSRSGSITPDDVALEFEGALATILRAITFATFDVRNGDWEAGNPDWPEWSDVAEWMYDAQAEFWKHAKIGDSAVRKRADDKGGIVPPWDYVTEEFTEAWQNLCAGIR
ncbi:MAG: hypothetical protein IIB38_10390, partial [Candidatus Hydrogenedentes bacterium]|nr:hypothetical protein [Candidatus Hydrogenedentota bacterium]